MTVGALALVDFLSSSLIPLPLILFDLGLFWEWCVSDAFEVGLRINGLVACGGGWQWIVRQSVRLINLRSSQQTFARIVFVPYDFLEGFLL